MDPITAPVVETSPVASALAIGFFVYLALLGVRCFRKNAADNFGLGISLLITAVAGFLASINVEIDIPVTVTNAEEGVKTVVDFPLLRSITELAGTCAGAGMAIRGIDIWRLSSGRERLLRFQRSAVFLGFLLVGVVTIYQMHFVSSFPMRAAILSIGGASVFIIGLALQSTLGNVVAGYSLQVSRTFRKGDTVQLGHGGIIGNIWDSTLTTTRILTRDGEMLTLLNSAILTKDFMNLDHPVPQLRQSIKVGISYSVPPANVKDVALQILRTEPGVLQNPPPQVWVADFADSAVMYDLRFWIGHFRDRDLALTNVRTRLWYALNDAGIEIPFPIRTVRMTSVADDVAKGVLTHQATERAIHALQACELFDEQNINATDRRELARAAIEMHFDTAAKIVHYGDSSDAMFVIAAGACEVVLPSGQRIPLKVGAHFGEIAMMKGDPRTADVVASTDKTVVIRLPRECVMPILLKRPELAARVKDVVAERLDLGVQPEELPARPVGMGFLRRLVYLLLPI